MTRDVSDVKHRKRGMRFEKSQLVEIETWARPDKFALRVPHMMGGGQIEKSA